MPKYDCAIDTIEHIRNVQKYMGKLTEILTRRAFNHDATKLQEEEKPYFDEYTPKLKTLEYGSEEYKKSLVELKVALDHHYSKNSHHPEYYKNGIDGMNLIDICEMLCDWIAAVERNKNGNIKRSMEENKKRFNISDQLEHILENTIDVLCDH